MVTLPLSISSEFDSCTSLDSDLFFFSRHLFCMFVICRLQIHVMNGFVVLNKVVCVEIGYLCQTKYAFEPFNTSECLSSKYMYKRYLLCIIITPSIYAVSFPDSTPFY